jgi:hypothetical protein
MFSQMVSKYPFSLMRKSEQPFPPRGKGKFLEGEGMGDFIASQIPLVLPETCVKKDRQYPPFPSHIFSDILSVFDT